MTALATVAPTPHKYRFDYKDKLRSDFGAQMVECLKPLERDNNYSIWLTSDVPSDIDEAIRFFHCSGKKPESILVVECDREVYRKQVIKYNDYKFCHLYGDLYEKVTQYQKTNPSAECNGGHLDWCGNFGSTTGTSPTNSHLLIRDLRLSPDGMLRFTFSAVLRNAHHLKERYDQWFRTFRIAAPEAMALAEAELDSELVKGQLSTYHPNFLTLMWFLANHGGRKAITINQAYTYPSSRGNAWMATIVLSYTDGRTDPIAGVQQLLDVHKVLE